MTSGIPAVTLTYSLADVATGVTNWFSGYWLMTAFAIAIPLTFFIIQQIKGVFMN
ncbi:hypothetical protein [Paenibacillus sp. FSL R7-0128]|uniref:hypothetical protein n=1 Tax=Paenibacillus sp. FSL R7-0128 TaxID=2954529 RepID=UPI0030FB4FA6